jgi:hypothetical protein
MVKRPLFFLVVSDPEILGINAELAALLLRMQADDEVQSRCED